MSIYETHPKYAQWRRECRYAPYLAKQMVARDWTEPVLAEYLPAMKRYGTKPDKWLDGKGMEEAKRDVILSGLREVYREWEKTKEQMLKKLNGAEKWLLKNHREAFLAELGERDCDGDYDRLMTVFYAARNVLRELGKDCPSRWSNPDHCDAPTSKNSQRF